MKDSLFVNGLILVVLAVIIVALAVVAMNEPTLGF